MEGGDLGSLDVPEGRSMHNASVSDVLCLELVLYLAYVYDLERDRSLLTQILHAQSSTTIMAHYLISADAL